jgi:error-prone DNA polymerase
MTSLKPEGGGTGRIRRPIRWAEAVAAGRRRAALAGRSPTPADPPTPPYAELACKSNFSLLEGASHPDELVKRAAELGLNALALADRNTLGGVVRAHVASKEAGLRLIVGAEVHPEDGPPVILLATDRGGYGRLCRLLTLGRRRVPKGEFLVSAADLADHAGGLVALAVPGPETAEGPLRRYRDIYGADAFLAVPLRRGPDDAAELARLTELARRVRLPPVATGAVLYHDRDRKPLQDALTCVRAGCTLETAGRRLDPNAERHLKGPAEMAALFAAAPEALRRTAEIADRCRFSLDELRYEYPEEVVPADVSAVHHLRNLTWEGAARRCPAGVPDKLRGLLEHELRLIAELRYEHFFLTVHDIVRFAESRGILCQGRGSAANSAVCWCLGITSVDPLQQDLLFERFISRERAEPPDIDVDFEHERREEVMQYVYAKYGRERAGIVAEVIRYRTRSAVRDMGKVLGLSLDRVDALSKALDHRGDGVQLAARLSEAGLDPAAFETRALIALVGQVQDFPRHLSQHVGGFIITRGRLDELVPIHNAGMPDRTFIEWDKDDCEALGLLKVDCLALGMLTCIRKCFELVGRHHGRELSLAAVPADDPGVFGMIRRADTVGVFQIESRAQMAMLPRLQPRDFYDLVIEVAIVRPGPSAGGMIHPFLRRRMGREAVTYPSEAVREVLHRTSGVLIFQEQAMRLAMTVGGFSPGEADQLRRAMGQWRKRDVIDRWRHKMMEGMRRNGLPDEFAEAVFEQLKGFGAYGFPESHAASFARLAWVSSWLKFHYPAAFACALVNSQPMGFYAPAQIIRDAQDHGVGVRPVDVNHSDWDCTLEGGPPSPAIRLGFRLIKGMRAVDAERLTVARRVGGPFRTMGDLSGRTGLWGEPLLRLAGADALGSLGLPRRTAVWEALRLGRRDDLPLFAGLEGAGDEASPPPSLPPEPAPAAVAADYAVTGLSLKAHPMAFFRERLGRLGHLTAAEVSAAPHGRRATASGLVLIRQRPQTAKGITFVTLEDETGVANLIIRPEVFERHRRAARSAAAVAATGRIQRDGPVVHVLAERVEDLADVLSSPAPAWAGSRDFR